MYLFQNLNQLLERYEIFQIQGREGEWVWEWRKHSGVNRSRSSLCFVTLEFEKSYFYMDLEAAMEWEDSPELNSKQNEKQNENDVKQKREWRFRSHSRFVLWPRQDSNLEPSEP